MSGHSKWSTIKHKKAAQDAKKGKVFTKLGRAISIAAREGGGDPETNFVLRLAIDNARKASMPADNIERAINRGTGQGDDGIVMEKVIYGGYGPGGVAIAVDTLTDNKNRTVSELRKIFETHGGNLADSSSVLWQFKEKGRIIVRCAKMEKSEKFGQEDKAVTLEKDDVIMALMDLEGITDVKEVDQEDRPDVDEVGKFEFCEVITVAKELAKVRDKIEELGYIMDSVEVAKFPENIQEISDSDAKKLQGLLEELDDNDDVENLWFNSNL